MTLRLSLSHGRYLTIVSVYAPTMSNPEEKKEEFYHEISSLCRKVPPNDKLIILGDFNARVGTDFNTWKSLGQHGVGKLNSNGLMLLQFCTEFNLLVSNTIFKQKDTRKFTWMHPQSKKWHLLDYILIRQRDRNDLNIVRVCPSAQCWTDHRLVRGKFKLNLKKKCKMKNINLPKRINVKKLNDPDIRNDFSNSFDILNGISDWEAFKTTVYKISSEKLGFTNKEHNDWFDETIKK